MVTVVTMFHRITIEESSMVMYPSQTGATHPAHAKVIDLVTVLLYWHH
jgi:hypothetical protein